MAPSAVRDAIGAIGEASWSELIQHLRLPRGPASRTLRRVVDGLVASGDVALSRRGRYRLTDEGEASVSKPPSSVIGRLEGRPRSWFVESLDPEYKERIDLVDEPHAPPGAVVEVEILGTTFAEATGRVKRLVEAGGESARAAAAMLAAYRIPTTWPPEFARIDVPASVPRNVAKTRKDLRGMPLVTIDGEDARDFDDAVFAEPRRNGWRLVVAIADVAHYVKTGSVLDREARERGNSVYLPRRVVPMLPEALSNGICSLVPNEDRLAMVCDMRVSRRGRVSSFGFYEAVIRSQARLTYTEVGRFLEGESLAVEDDIVASLSALHEVYRALRTSRNERGALDLDTRETWIELDDDGMPTAIGEVSRNDAHLLVEEAMIAANVAAARHLESKEDGAGGRVPPVYRVHEPPSAEKMEALAAALRLAGERLPNATPTPAELTTVLARARAKSSWPVWIWETLVLRSLAQARYEPRRLGHYGLALSTYAHFTSPIRRYSDLLIHRMLKGERPSLDDLETASSHISMTERRAEDAERAVDAWLKCVFVQGFVGEKFSGTVASVVEFGLFVDLDGLFVQGLVHISQLGRDYYHYSAESMSLVAERSGARFALGDRLEVVVQDVSVARGRIDLVLASRVGRRRRRRR
ncbi:MAG: VacB/RNase II family 3'-5' exoribonuclease [Gammaproteobacteria bacterium]|nr:VacB/RNase II family 3'-5' exoribonuclease [Gammaproteobacteria bacterium]